MFGWIKRLFGKKPQPKRVAPVAVTPVGARRTYVSMAPRPASAPTVAPDTSNDMAYWLLMNQAMQNSQSGHFAPPSAAQESERFTSGGGGDFGGAGATSSWDASPAPSPSYDTSSSYDSGSSCSSSDSSSSSSDSSSSCSSSD